MSNARGDTHEVVFTLFTHREAWTEIGGDERTFIFRRMGELGFELVSDTMNDNHPATSGCGNWFKRPLDER